MKKINKAWSWNNNFDKKTILFRGKQESGVWRFGYYMVGKRDDSKFPAYIIFENNVPYFVDKDTVGQFVNRVAENGRGIFEGDIIQSPDGTGRVYWDMHYLNWQIVTKTGEIKAIPCKAKEIIILGNIYDNPELFDLAK